MSERKINQLHPRDQIIMVINRIYKKGLTTTSGGNISIMDDHGDMWVTPSGVDKGSLKPADIMCVKANGQIEGLHRPSMEYPFHKAIYEKRPDLKAVVHAHPPGLVSFSIVRQTPATKITPRIHQICGPIGYAKYHIPGSQALGDSISEQFAKGFTSVIMENHGAVVGGTNVFDAYQRFETLEYCARMMINGKTIGEPKQLNDQQIAAFEAQSHQLVPTHKEECLTTQEKETCQTMCQMVLRACDQGLMMSGYGTISVRTGGNSFLITPSDVIRWDMKPEDIIRIENGEFAAGKTPCPTVRLHQKIYEQHPGIHAIIITQPEYLMAYGITHRKVDVRTIPESWIFLQDMQNVAFGSQFVENDTIPNLLSKENPGVIVENDSVLMTGNSLLQAFDRLEVAEFSAKSLVMGTTLGAFAPMNDHEIEELRKAFF